MWVMLSRALRQLTCLFQLSVEHFFDRHFERRAVDEKSCRRELSYSMAPELLLSCTSSDVFRWLARRMQAGA